MPIVEKENTDIRRVSKVEGGNRILTGALFLHLLVVHLLRCLVFFAYVQGFTSRSLDVPGYPKYLKRSMHPCFVLYFSRENFSERVKICV